MCVGREGGREGGRVLLTKDWRLDMAFGVDGDDVVRVDGRAVESSVVGPLAGCRGLELVRDCRCCGEG